MDWVYFGQHQDPENNKISRVVLKETCQLLDGTRPYWPSSPHTPTPGPKPTTPLEGDNHLWYHGTYFKDPIYSEDRSRFSEIGHLAAPSVETILSFLPKEKVWPPDEEYWSHHFGSHRNPDFQPQRRQKMEEAMKRFFGALPDNLKDYVLASQIVQAEALKFFIERARQRKFECGGILWWNVIDCWPQFSDAIVDYYFRKKLAYHYVKRLQQTVLISLGEPSNHHIPILITNDSANSVNVRYRVQCVEPPGLVNEVLGTVKVGENSTQTVGEVDLSGIKSGQHALLQLYLEHNGEVTENNYLLGAPPFNLVEYKGYLKRIEKLNPF